MSQSINADTFHTFDPSRVPSPCFVIDKAVIERNLQCLNHIQERSGAKVLAALKAFSMWHLGPLTQHYLSGTCASGINEAKLGKAYYGGEVHTFSAAFKRQELLDVLEISDHIVFNTVSQWQRFQSDICAAKKKRPHLEFGLRINPRHSEGEVEIYDPCAPKSRLGISAENFPFDQLEGITGLHFHTLCEQGVQPLKRTLAAVEKQFGDVIHSMKWINFGGGHHITKPGYDTEELIELIKSFAERYAVQVYLEPGEAVAIHSGVLVCEVLDLTHNDTAIALLDTSATCHMPDTLEMPYRADIFNAGQALEKKHTYRLGGMTCLAGDIMGDYSFDQALEVGQRLMFDDMAHYTMVKTSTFNGINLPSIALWDSRTDELEIIKQFDYQDFAMRLS